MTDRAIPHASTVANAAVARLAALGEQELSDALATIHRATCDLVHAIHTEREAPTHSLQLDAREKAARALATLRYGTHATAAFESR
jgi:hypothetical protein